MSERKQGPDWDLLKARVDHVKISAKFALDRVVHELKYRAFVPNEQHKQASRLAEEFAGEGLTFSKR